MAEISGVNFSHTEIAVLMLKDRGIHEGLWQLSVEFGLARQTLGRIKTTLLPLQSWPFENGLKEDSRGCGAD